jgi:chitosanase
MSISKSQKHAIDCILSIFETGKVPTAASYSTCTILRDGAGISYGKHQATDNAGSLDKIVQKYIAAGGVHADKLKAYLPQLAANETAKLNPSAPPDWAKNLVSLLKEAGADPKMQAAQDEVFDENYWNPAVNHASQIGLKTALGHAVVYDTCIHSGPGRVATHRAAFPQKSPANGGDEKEWVKAYVGARKAWLLGNKNPLVQKTIYRMEAFEKLMADGNWDLVLPFTVRGVKVSE